ncbi:MAG: hypothetical protein K9N49_08370 [Candidatus Marinimicrobia bacterium]|nr:hypothetical protein [Candidatus Neomarinimicrobiota bacterium]
MKDILRSRRRGGLFCCLALGLLAGGADGARAAGPAWDRYPVLGAPLMVTAPTIDGTLAADEWLPALRVPALLADITGNAAADQTEVYLGYTDEALYLAWRVRRSFPGPLMVGSPQPG